MTLLNANKPAHKKKNITQHSTCTTLAEYYVMVLHTRRQKIFTLTDCCSGHAWTYVRMLLAPSVIVAAIAHGEEAWEPDSVPYSLIGCPSRRLVQEIASVQQCAEQHEAEMPCSHPCGAVVGRHLDRQCSSMHKVHTGFRGPLGNPLLDSSSVLQQRMPSAHSGHCAQALWAVQRPHSAKLEPLSFIAQKLQRRAQENTSVPAQAPAAFPGVTAASCRLCRAKAPSSLCRPLLLLQMAWQLPVALRQLHTRRLQPLGEHSLAPERAWRQESCTWCGCACGPAH